LDFTAAVFTTPGAFFKQVNFWRRPASKNGRRAPNRLKTRGKLFFCVITGASKPEIFHFGGVGNWKRVKGLQNTAQRLLL
jgi:hypothetical protein